LVEQSLNTYKKTIKDEETQVVYNLIFKNALYSFECYKEGANGHRNYCYIENLTEDEGEAETFLKQMAKSQVLPIHIKDIAEDIFGK
jgi:hypothetical protein